MLAFTGKNPPLPKRKYPHFSHLFVWHVHPTRILRNANLNPLNPKLLIGFLPENKNSPYTPENSRFMYCTKTGHFLKGRYSNLPIPLCFRVKMAVRFFFEGFWSKLIRICFFLGERRPPFEIHSMKRISEHPERKGGSKGRRSCWTFFRGWRADSVSFREGCIHLPEQPKTNKTSPPKKKHPNKKKHNKKTIPKLAY